MRKIFVYFLLIALFFLNNSGMVFAFDSSKVSLSVNKVNNDSLQGIIDKRLTKKFLVYEVQINNKNKEEILVSNNINYTDQKGIKYKIPSNQFVFEKAKRHSIRRSVLWGCASIVSFFILLPAAVIGSIAYTSTKNSSLMDNIQKNSFVPKHLYENDLYSFYLFIPKKYKNLDSLSVFYTLEQANSSSFSVETKFVNEI